MVLEKFHLIVLVYTSWCTQGHTLIYHLCRIVNLRISESLESNLLKRHLIGREHQPTTYLETYRIDTDFKQTVC